ncbi:MAG: hypothetical protein PVH29_00845 [Candidatus Zixiibacteriota bacterium]|jgi:hypothetical protein
MLFAALAAVVLACAAVLFYLIWFRPWQLTWGATAEELARPMPGDELVPDPDLDSTRAVTVDASAADVWPWLVQIGYRRAGFYSYGCFDNAGLPSADRILPEYQGLKAGDDIPLSDTDGMKVVTLEPPRFMVWNHPTGILSWAWGLYPDGEGRTRLVTRLHARYVWKVPAIFGYFIVDFGDFIMMRKCMLGIKRRAEGRSVDGGGISE